MKICKYRKVVIPFWIFISVSIWDTISYSFAEGKQKIPEKYRGLKHKGTVKTIVSPEDDLVIDCIDFYKQPAFDDPLIKKLQVDPSFFPGGTKQDNDLKKSGLYQNWRKYGECPNGTIPIRRIQNRNIHRKNGMPSNDATGHEYAIVTNRNGKYYGGRADFNLWEPKTELGEFSLAQIWVASGTAQPKKMNTIEAGWIVFPKRYQDTRPVTFIFWTGDGYNKTGCYDLDCPGFIQTCADYCIGVPIDSSIYNSPVSIYDIHVEIYQHQNGPYRNWIYNLNGKTIGYWPGRLFDSLTDGADKVTWGGEIVNKEAERHHTSTEMGSGHFPDEGYSRASYVKKLAMMNADKKWFDAKETDLSTYVTNPGCYEANIHSSTARFGTHFYYGGPGYSPQCRF